MMKELKLLLKLLLKLVLCSLIRSLRDNNDMPLVVDYTDKFYYDNLYEKMTESLSISIVHLPYLIRLFISELIFFVNNDDPSL